MKTLGNLFTERTLRRIEDAIDANRHEAAAISRDRSPEAGERMNQLNAAWFDLETEKHRLTGIDPAPYRMGR